MKTTLKIISISLGLFFVFASHVHAEVIKSFDSQIVVNTDSSVSVMETIIYDTEGQAKHGIYRDITPKNANGETMKIQNISVSDEGSAPYEWQQQTNSGEIRLKIGDPNTTFVGEKTYIVRYMATNAVSYFDSYDEIYWNATGNAWPFPIRRASATVILPNDARALQQSCYVGVVGSTEICGTSGSVFTSARVLEAGEGLTVAVGFPKGVVIPPIPPSWWQRHMIIVFAILFPIMLFIFLYRRWRKLGRDPKDTRVVVPQYEVPEGLTPMEVAVIVNEKSTAKDISAEIVYLATEGYLKIRQTDQILLGLIHTKDYEVILLKDPSSLPNDHDQKLINKIFTSPAVGSTRTLSSLKNSFYSTIPILYTSVKNTMLSKAYYSYFPGMKSAVPFSFFGKIIGILGVLIVLSKITTPVVTNVSRGAVVLAGIVSLVLVVIFQKLMPAKTEKGVSSKNYLLGLKQYLQIAEKDRLAFHNAPEKKPETFEKLLPFAMVLGVEHAWAKEFEGMYTTPPSWYEGTNMNAFSAGIFADSLSQFSHVATSSFSATPHSSGSGGGGFSGGGGGGGGGGSW